MKNIMILPLKYIYGGKLSLNEYDNSDIIKVLVAASELNLQELVTYLQFFLVKNKTSWMEKNFNFVYQTSFENDSFPELQKYCIELISKEPDKIFKSPDFTSIPEKLLISIIQNDNLQTSEVQIWEHVLKWGLAQNPKLPSEITNFSKDDFNTLINILLQCIPFIRFYNLTSKEFVDKVFPHREILPEELCTDLLKTFLTLSNPDNSSYEFKLLFRASRDGHSRDKFHMICDIQSHTVVLVKVKGSNEILGGYNPIEWKSDKSYSTTKYSFIFSFNNERIDNHILSHVMFENYAIYNSSGHGPLFGISDLIIWDSFHKNYCKKSSYKKSIRKTEGYFNIEECEVFQIGSY
ncbi:uncharacterized protein OCT59_021294 [Rhizophagus irregularis]|uniref:uncharacterized protein n=1 Tax=Rhizophagus irregularis TaxID=588596 RepID=UPI003318FCBF|nr:hypothetical protein OCT59_021294 [Rhizophagus irregularis]